MIFMLQCIMDGDIMGDKAQRWLGYAQGLAVMLGLATLDTVKEINHHSGEARDDG